MKPNLDLLDEFDAEVVNRQPNAEERREISAAIRADKERLEGLVKSCKEPNGPSIHTHDVSTKG